MPEGQLRHGLYSQGPCKGCEHAIACKISGQSCDAFNRFVFAAACDPKWESLPRAPSDAATAIYNQRHAHQVRIDIAWLRRLEKRQAAKMKGRADRQRALSLR